MLSSIAIMIYMKIDQIMLGEMTNSKEIGIYSAAVHLSEAWYFVPVAVANSVFPAIVQYRLIDKNLYYQKLQNLFCLMVAISYLVAIPCTFLAPRFVNLIFGNEYQETGVVLSIHIWSGLFVALGVVRGLWIISENANYFQLFSTLLGALVNIILNILLIPEFQAIGASIATIISYCIAAYLLCFLSVKTRKIAYLMSKSLILQK